MMKYTVTLITGLLLPSVAAYAAEGDPAASDLALQPAHVIVSPWKQHIPPTKRQGVAGIECTARGRLWVVYGRDVESTRNFQACAAAMTTARRGRKSVS